MENVLNRFRFRRFKPRWIENAVFRVVVGLSRWLRHSSPEKWDSVVYRVEKGPRRGLGRPEIVAYTPNKQEWPENRYQQGSSVDTLPRKIKPIVLPEWAKEISPFLANQLSDHTRRAYETDLKQFFSFLEGRIEPADITALSPEHIILFRKSLEEGRLTGRVMEKSTINRKLAVVKSFLNWLRANRVLSDNPAQLVKGFPQSQESSLKGLSDEEVTRMLDLPSHNSRSGAMHRAVLSCLLYLGLRKGELIDLKVGDISEERGVPVVKVRGKGHRIRILPITAKVSYALKHYFFVCNRVWTETEEPLFLPTKNPRTKTLLKTLNPNAISYIVIRYAKKAGILKRISPHSCRATCISNALDRKATHRSVQHLAGWSTPLMIQRYDKRREDLKNSAAFLIDYGSDEKVAAPSSS